MRLIPVIIALLLTATVRAQESSNLWMRLSVRSQIGSSRALDIEGQYRQQNILGPLHAMNAPLLGSVRPWLNYTGNSRIRLSISPAAYFLLRPLLLHDGDGQKPSRNELRTSLAEEYQTKSKAGLSVIARLAEEGRIIDDGTRSLRVRVRTGIQYCQSERFKGTVYQETMYNVAASARLYGFDQFRIGTEIRVRASRHLEFAMGYMRVLRAVPGSSAAFDNNVLMTATYTARHR